MPKRICIKAHEYDCRQVAVGEAFEVEQKHIELQLRLGRIEPNEGEYGYGARDMAAAGQAGYATTDMAAKPAKRAYHRKAA